MRENKTFILSLVYILTIINFSCKSAPERLDPKSFEDGTLHFYKEVRYDKYGLPSFHKELNEQPAEIGNSYFAVILKSKMLLCSYYIAIVSKAKMKKVSFQAKPVIKWAKRGVKVGIQSISGAQISDPRQLIALPAAWAASICICTGFGVIIGTMESTGKLIIDAGIKAKRKILGEGVEVLLLYYTYTFDELGRLKESMLYQPLKNQEPVELLKTTYYYKGRKTLPFKTEIWDQISNKKEIIINK